MERIWRGGGLRERLLRALLVPLSWLYGIGWRFYLLIYRLGIKKPYFPKVLTICVGNGVVGGSGKSPFVAYLVGKLRENGQKVVISCSGYGSPAQEAAEIAPDGPLDPARWGDEPSMFREQFPDIPLVVGRRRVLAAQLVAKQHPEAVLLMDDGLQHLPIRPTIRIALDDPNATNRLCLPAGPYREPVACLNRFDLMIPGKFKVETSDMWISTPGSIDVRIEPRGLSADVLCAIGQPEKFIAGLQSMGVLINSESVLVDHDPLSGINLLQAFSPERPILVTQKDWVKLRKREDAAKYQFLIVRHNVRPQPEEEFLAWLHQQLHEIQTKTA